MGRSTTNFNVFKRKNINNLKINNDDPSMSISNVDIPVSKKYSNKILRNPNR
jgi:hypothetical protein